MKLLLHYFCTLLLFDVFDAKRLEDIVTIVANKTPKDAKPPKASSRGPLGQAFFLHKMDLLSKQLQATGTEIFRHMKYDKCILTDKVATIEDDSTFFSSTESLYQAVGTETKVDASLKGTYTLGASVSAVTNNIASENTQVSGLSLIIKSENRIEGLKKDCINYLPLSERFMKDFQMLPSKIKDPAYRQSWSMYEVRMTQLTLISCDKISY